MYIKNSSQIVKANLTIFISFFQLHNHKNNKIKLKHLILYIYSNAFLFFGRAFLMGSERYIAAFLIQFKKKKIL